MLTCLVAQAAFTGQLSALSSLLGLLATVAWLAWRFGPTRTRLTGWGSWRVAWACGSQGGYGYCVAFRCSARSPGRRDDLVRQASRPLALARLRTTPRADAEHAHPLQTA